MEEGRNFFEKRNPAEALSRFLIVAERFNDADSPEEKGLCIRALNNAGCVYKYLYYNYPMAYEYFRRAYDLSETSHLNELQPLVMVNMGDLLNDYAVLYNSDSFSEQVKALFEDCFNQAMANKNWELMTTAFYNLSNGNYDIPLSHYKAIFSEDIPADTPDLQFSRLQYLGIEAIQKKDYSRAREHFERQLLSVSTKWEPQRDSITALMNIARTYQLEQNPGKANEVLLTALSISDRSGVPDISAEIARQLSDSYLAAGDSAAYDTYHLFYLEKREELNHLRLANIGELKYISDLRKEEKKAREATIRQHHYQSFVRFLIIVVVIIAISANMFWRQNRKLKNRNASLFDRYHQLLEAEAIQTVTQKQDSSLKNALDDERRDALLAKIKEALGDPDIICRPDFTLKQLADMVGSNTTYVSRIINDTFGLTFSTLVGNYRVRTVCQRIDNSDIYDNLTIEGIANSVGFKSRTAFLNAFKREVGLSPSEYIKVATRKKR